MTADHSHPEFDHLAGRIQALETRLDPGTAVKAADHEPEPGTWEADTSVARCRHCGEPIALAPGEQAWRNAATGNPACEAR